MWAEQMAKLMKGQKEGKGQGLLAGPVIGKVVSASPVKISLYSGAVILDKDDVLVCESVSLKTCDVELEITAGTGAMGLNGQNTPVANCSLKAQGEMTQKGLFEKGDELLLLPTSDQLRYFIIDKLIRLEG